MHGTNARRTSEQACSRALQFGSARSQCQVSWENRPFHPRWWAERRRIILQEKTGRPMSKRNQNGGWGGGFIMILLVVGGAVWLGCALHASGCRKRSVSSRNGRRAERANARCMGRCARPGFSCCRAADINRYIGRPVSLQSCPTSLQACRGQDLGGGPNRNQLRSKSRGHVSNTSDRFKLSLG